MRWLKHSAPEIDDRTVTKDELKQVIRANESGKVPVVFVHGLWLLSSSWDRWAKAFETAGYTAVLPGWPDDPDTVAEANAHPEVFAKKSVGEIADHVAAVISKLDRKPAVVGHSFGGLLTQIIAGRGCRRHRSRSIRPRSAASRLADLSVALRFTVLRNPLNRHRASSLTYDQFRYAFANATDEEEAKSLYDTYAVPGSGGPCSRRRRPTSTHGPKPRSTPRTLIVVRC